MVARGRSMYGIRRRVMKTNISNRGVKSALSTLTAGMIAALGLALSSQAQAGTITGSAHDFSTRGYTGGQICVVCHTPHNSDTTVISAPLWNHEITTTTFTMYSSGSLDATSTGQPGGISKLCLSCHDGTVAIDSFGGTNGGDFLSGPKAVGRSGNLSDDHPISITYDTALSQTDQGLHDPTTRTVTIGTGGDKTRTGTVAQLMLSNGTVQCSSCHDVHNNFAVPGAPGTPLLKVTKAGSTICLTCHNK